ncbi:TonB-dependent receptor [Fusobacterium perfoetens]|uniref:TonB-dependent receptor n=1 Tax=Fusobacterium perfoetens TaxID=852 RepID=UPI0004890487|nr:TonB-dependent receptor [Fusobacterium perfoetens]
MKKLALLLAAVGMVSAVAYAAPELKVTSVGQEIEIENWSNGPDLDEVNLFNNVGLAYGDWTFGLQAGKQWAINFDDTKDVTSKNHRLQIDVWKKVTDDLKLGFRYRGTSSYDRYYARWDWSNGMLWSAGDVWYESYNGNKTDWLKTEIFPIGLKYGVFKVGYFLNYNTLMGGADVNDNDEYIEHQIRAYATLYKTDRLTLTAEGRFTISADEKYNGVKPHREYDDFGRNRLYLGADYKVTENLNVYGKFGYEYREWRLEDNAIDDHTQKIYQDIIVGWSYKF